MKRPCKIFQIQKMYISGRSMKLLKKQICTNEKE